MKVSPEAQYGASAPSAMLREVLDVAAELSQQRLCGPREITLFVSERDPPRPLPWGV
jgi:hypothetical protein